MEFIEILSPSALKDLQTANTEVLMLIKNIDNAGKSMQNIKTPSGSDSAVKNLNASLIRQEKLLQQQQKALEKARVDELKLYKQREKAFDKYEVQLTKEQAKLNASLNIYNKTQQQLNNITKVYNDLITRKLRYNNLSENEEKRLITLQKVTERYNTTLKAVDATIGKNQRNVGNYASAFNPLSNSINQLTREMPAFTYSVQTGFMALSNNIPIFTDAIGNAIKQNKLLQADGEPTTSVLSQLAGAFFSWGTALSVAITLTTVYGKEIGIWVKGLIDGGKAIDIVKESQKQLNDINQEGRKNAVEETLNLKSLLAIAKDTNLSYKERVIAVNELQSTYPAYFGNLKQEQILAGNTANAERELTNAILSRAKANAAVSKITENQKLIIDLELEKLDLSKKLTLAEQQYNKALKTTATTSSAIGGLSGASQEANVFTIKNKILEINKKIASQNSINNILTSFAIEKQKESILLKAKEEKGTKQGTKAKEEELKVTEEIVKNSEKAFKSTISALEEQLANTDRFSESYDTLNGLLQFQKTLYDQLFGSIKKATEAKEEYLGIELSDEQVYADYFAWLKLKEATDSYLKTLSSDAFNKAFDNIGLSSAKMFLDFDANGMSTFDKLIEGATDFEEQFAVTFQAVGDVAQDVFNKINELSNQRFENQKANLEREYKIGLAFAGDSASARAEIEKQYQDRQKQIQRNEFKAKKAQALVNIAMDTAQGVVSALASTPPNVPLSIAIGAIGLVQAGIVASQQMPQFYKGTDNAPEGWAWTQEKGAEIITDKSGKIKTTGTNKGAQMTYLNKGDKVYTAQETTQLMHNQALNNILTSSGIAPTNQVINNVDVDFSGVISAIENKPVANIGIDKNGLEMYVTNANQNKEVMNKRITFSGKSV